MTSLTNTDDTRVDMDIKGNGFSQAEERLQILVSLAKKIQSDPCIIEVEKHDESDNAVIHAHFDFCCAAEKLIFQLNYMYNSKYKIQ